MTFQKQVEEIAALVIKKNAAYGNSFGTAGEALRILYPDGIKTEQYETALLVTRIWDKLKRLATANDPYGEDPFVDVAGYAICGATLPKKETNPSLEPKPCQTSPEHPTLRCNCYTYYSSGREECPIHPFLDKQ